MKKSCENCVYSDRPSYDWPCTACVTAYDNPPTKWKGIEEQKEVATDTNDGCKWIPVTERLPERGQEVIVYSGGVLKPSVFAYQFWNNDFLSWSRITHWMPLPEPPKEVE